MVGSVGDCRGKGPKSAAIWVSNSAASDLGRISERAMLGVVLTYGAIGKPPAVYFEGLPESVDVGVSIQEKGPWPADWDREFCPKAGEEELAPDMLSVVWNGTFQLSPSASACSLMRSSL